MKKVSDKVILEDMSAMLKDTVDFERTLEMVKLNDDELLIFKRAANQLKKAEPNMAVLRKAYDIFIVKSYNNTSNHAHYDSQAIIGDGKERKGIITTINESKPAKVFIAVIVVWIGLKIFL